MRKKNTINAKLLSPEVKALLEASSDNQITNIIENNEVKIKNSLQNAFEELNKVIKDDLEEARVVDEESALEYFYNFRHSNE